MAGRRVEYRTAGEVIRELRNSWRRDSNESDAEVLERLGKLDLLVIDEVGVQFGTDGELVQFTELLDTRYRQNRPTVIVSNCNREGLKQYLGERVLDRLRENGEFLVLLTGQSLRGTRDRN